MISWDTARYLPRQNRASKTMSKHGHNIITRYPGVAQTHPLRRDEVRVIWDEATKREFPGAPTDKFDRLLRGPASLGKLVLGTAPLVGEEQY